VGRRMVSKRKPQDPPPPLQPNTGLLRRNWRQVFFPSRVGYCVPPISHSRCLDPVRSSKACQFSFTSCWAWGTDGSFQCVDHLWTKAVRHWPFTRGVSKYEILQSVRVTECSRTKHDTRKDADILSEDFRGLWYFTTSPKTGHDISAQCKGRDRLCKLNQ